MLQVIGKVSATEKMPSTIDNFYFWTDKGQILSPFDIVKVEHVSSNSDKSITYGVIEEITHVTDAASHFTNFISSNFGDTAGFYWANESAWNELRKSKSRLQY